MSLLGSPQFRLLMTMKRRKISFNQAAALIVFHDANGPVRVTDLAKFTETSVSLAGQLVTNLERKQLVAPVRVGRMYRYGLTDHGRKIAIDLCKLEPSGLRDTLEALVSTTEYVVENSALPSTLRNTLVTASEEARKELKAFDENI